MIEGFDHDDRYRMVEDEFLAVANDFTKHLHAAEYQRLKALASTRNADMIRTISRPVTGRMTDLVKKRRTALELAASQRKGIRNALGKRKGRENDDSDDDDGDLPWAGTSLQGLMESPRKTAVPLPAGSSLLGHGERTSTTRDRPRQTTSLGLSDFASRVGIKPSTSHVESTTDDDDDDDDDLDTQPRFPRRTEKVERSESSALSLNQKAASIDAMARRRESTRPPRSTSGIEVKGRPRAERLVEKPIALTATDAGNDSEDDDDDFLASIRRRRGQQKSRREGSRTQDNKKAKHTSVVDSIPMF